MFKSSKKKILHNENNKMYYKIKNNFSTSRPHNSFIRR